MIFLGVGNADIECVTIGNQDSDNPTNNYFTKITIKTRLNNGTIKIGVPSFAETLTKVYFSNGVSPWKFVNVE